MDNTDNTFNEFLLSILTGDNGALVSELRQRWNEWRDGEKPETSHIDRGWYWAVQKNTFDILKCHFRIYKEDNWITFQTEEAAKEYVLMNKPCLSYKDVIAEHSNDFGYFKLKIQQLAEQKLKQ